MLFPFLNVNANFLPMLLFFFLKIFYHFFWQEGVVAIKFPSLFIWESLYFLLHFWRLIHKVQRFRLFLLWALNFSLHCLICMASWEMLDAFPFLVWKLHAQVYCRGSKGSYLSCFVISGLPGCVVSCHINLGNFSVIIVLNISSIYFSIFWFSHCAWKLSRFSCVWLTATVGIVTSQTPLSIGFSRQEYWSGLPCLQGIFPTQGSNPCLRSGKPTVFPLCVY